uniref:Uncharacterized protein n=1 Tax=Glossina brevipalpis TaxID=37001 RepID=A0A1A9WQX7_9MUSC
MAANIQQQRVVNDQLRREVDMRRQQVSESFFRWEANARAEDYGLNKVLILDVYVIVKQILYCLFHSGL